MGSTQSAPAPQREVVIHLAASVFLPGNLIHGAVSLNYGRQVSLQQLGVLLTCELHQHWTTTHTYSTGSGKNRRTHTRTVHHYKTTPLIKLTIQIPHQGTAEHGQQFPFTYVLDPRSLPSIERIEKCKLRYYFQGVYSGPDTQGNNLLGFQTPIQVLMPMSGTMYNQVSTKSELREFSIICCCCCDKGKCKATFSMSKTIIALDRDSIGVQVEIDNTASEADCEAVVVSLDCNGTVKIGHPCVFGDRAGSIRIPANVKAGESKTIQGVLQLDPRHPPSFASSVVDIAYNVTCGLVMSWADDVAAAFPVFVAHTVDMSDQVAQFQQAYNTFQPIQENAMPVMYQPPAQANAAFDMPPPPMYQALPPIEFAQLPADGEGASPTGPAAAGGYGQMQMQQQQQMQQQPPPGGYAGQPPAFGPPPQQQQGYGAPPPS